MAKFFKRCRHFYETIRKKKSQIKELPWPRKKIPPPFFSNSWADHVCGMSCQSNTYTSSYTYIIFNVFKKRNPLLLFERCEEWLETDNLSLELLFELWGGVIALTRSWWCDIVKAIFCLNFFSSCQLVWIFFSRLKRLRRLNFLFSSSFFLVSCCWEYLQKSVIMNFLGFKYVYLTIYSEFYNNFGDFFRTWPKLVLQV